MDSLDIAILVEDFCHRTGKEYLQSGEDRGGMIDAIVLGLDHNSSKWNRRICDIIRFLEKQVLSFSPYAFEALNLLEMMVKYIQG